MLMPAIFASSDAFMAWRNSTIASSYRPWPGAAPHVVMGVRGVFAEVSEGAEFLFQLLVPWSAGGAGPLATGVPRPAGFPPPPAVLPGPASSLVARNIADRVAPRNSASNPSRIGRPSMSSATGRPKSASTVGSDIEDGDLLEVVVSAEHGTAQDQHTVLAVQSAACP